MDKCVEEKMGIERPPLGYFSTLHVHDSSVPKPGAATCAVLELCKCSCSERKLRDYKAEAAEVLKELPKDYVLRDDYKKFMEFHKDILERG